MSENTIPIFLNYFEVEIIQLLIMYYTKKQIANKFHLSEETIEKHIENIIEKIDKVQSCNCYYLTSWAWINKSS